MKCELLRGAERIWPPSGARAERGRMERGAAKPRGRCRGRRNRKMDFAFLKQNVLLFILHQEENT